MHAHNRSRSVPNAGDVAYSNSIERVDTNLSSFTTDSRASLVANRGSRARASALPFHREAPGAAADRRYRTWTETFHEAFSGWRLLVLGSWLNLLLFIVPIAWTVSVLLPESHALIFATSIFALIPLVRLHDLAITQVSRRIGGANAGLLHATMIVVGFTALRNCELTVVQSSPDNDGHIFLSLVLVLGLCFFAGGIRFAEQGFDPTATQIHSSLLSIGVGGILLPAVYHFALSGEIDDSSEWQKLNILYMSHGVSMVLISVYICYMVFQLYSHRHLYEDNRVPSHKHVVKPPPSLVKLRKAANASLSLKASMSNLNLAGKASQSQEKLGSYPSVPPGLERSPTPGRESPLGTPPRSRSRSRSPSLRSIYLGSGTPPNGAHGQIPASGTASSISILPGGETVRLVELPPLRREDTTLSSGPGMPWTDSYPDVYDSRAPSPAGTVAEPEAQKAPKVPPPQLSWFLTLSTLTLVTIAVSVTADWLVESMNGVSDVISKEWVALILLPAVTSLAECLTAVTVSVKDQLELSVSVAVGSTIQTVLFVIPLMVVSAWAMEKPLSLLFDPFMSLVLYLSVQTMGFVVADGKSNWMEGVILISFYVIVAVSYWFYPGSTFASSLAVCHAN
ncbi:Sodium/calcium exchanger protein-domain-containing protein [Schizophyllum commune]